LPPPNTTTVLSTIQGGISNLFVDKQQAVTAAKRKEDDAEAAAQAVIATAHQEQEILIAAVAAACKTLDEARTRERAATLAWEKETTIARHQEQQLASRIYDRWSRSFWNPRHPTTSGDAILCFSRFVAMPWMTTSSLTSSICPSIGLDWTTSW
jgi:hypothetical protein